MFLTIFALKRDTQGERCSEMRHEALKGHENLAKSSDFELLMESQILQTAVLGGREGGERSSPQLSIEPSSAGGARRTRQFERRGVPP